MNGTVIREDLEIAGVSWHDPGADDFAHGGNQQMRLHWQDDNEFHENAIQVIGTWTDSHGLPHEAAIGYVPRKVADEIANEHSAGVPLRARIKDVHDPGFPVPKIYIDVLLS